MSTTDTIITILTTLGGFEFLKWLYKVIVLGSNVKKKDNAETESAEFAVLREQLNAANEQNKELMDRVFAIQDAYNTLQDANTEIVRNNAMLEQWKCEVKKCPNRIPPNGM